MGELRITSSGFMNGEFIPSRFTADGADVNPPIKIDGVPENAKSLVLIMDDPDAPVGVWDHWVLFNIPPNVTEIPENSTPTGAVLGKNSWGRAEYGGPAPPSGIHRYFFKLYALDTALNLPAGASKAQVESAAQGHILAEATLMGKYTRRK